MGICGSRRDDITKGRFQNAKKNVSVFRIMIASPGDVKKERNLAVKAIYRWNSTHSLKTNVVLLPLTWEMDVPQGVAIESQDLINDSLLNNSDMVIGIFYKKMGRKGISGNNYTIDELISHINNGKQAILFFREINGIRNLEDSQKAQEVLYFKKHLKDSLHREALYLNYKGPGDFEKQIYERLELAVQKYLLPFASNGIDRVCNTTFSEITIFRKSLQDRISEASDSIFISGASLISTLTTNFDLCIHNGVRIRLLTTALDVELIERCAQLSYTTPAELTGHIGLVHGHFLDLPDSHGIEIKCIDAVMPFAMVGIDIEGSNGRIYVQQYMYEYDPAKNPNYVCYAGEKWFDIYKDQIERLWLDGQPLSRPPI